MRERRAATVYVKGTMWGLESALARTLAHALGTSAEVRIGEPENLGGGDVVVTTDAASSPTEVSDLTEKGDHVVVLAALPSETAEAGYRNAGARAYLPMVVAAAPLIAAVGGLLTSLAEAF
jgi:hypothetical protein